MYLSNYLAKLLLLSLPAVSFQAFGWGQKGHDTTAAIAERHLTPAAKCAIDSLLEGKSIIYWSNWMDNASHTPQYDYSLTWHYKNIDAGQDYDKAKPIKEGDVVTAINEQYRILTDPSSGSDQRLLALKILVHLAGDIHQPMHMGHKSDRGGNRWYVKFFKNPTNLHSVWDSNLPEAAHKWSYTEWTDNIDRLPTETVLELVQGLTADDWGRETFSITSQVYDSTPQDTLISYDYIADWSPVVEQQFLKGGLRLADLLNDIFDPDYTPLHAPF